MSVGAEEFKTALRRWASGVSVVTAQYESRSHGITVSAFASVSLTPPLVLVCIKSVSPLLSLIEAAGTFAVNILSTEQQDVSNVFARPHDADRFASVPFRLGHTGAPILTGVLAALECSVSKTVDAGDHTVVFGEVLRTEIHESDPLLHFSGDYREIKRGTMTRLGDGS